MNILVLTSIYPIPGTASGFTPVVRYFCEHWVKLGHHVVAIVNSTKFPKVFYALPKSLNEIISSYIGFNVPNKFLAIPTTTILNGVHVFQLPISKVLPGEILSDKKTKKQYELIISILNDISFKPDLILGHWMNPQIQLIAKLKTKYASPTSLVLHNSCSRSEEKLLKKYKNGIDYIGFRNFSLRRSFEQNPELVGINKTKFICYSGVDLREEKHSLSGLQSKLNFTKEIKIIYVGALIKRKYPIAILKAIDLLPLKQKISVHYIGEGAEQKKIKAYFNRDGKEVKLLGQIERKDVYRHLRESAIFIMISKHEAFGLVYLEAMLNGCITIASKDEGFDGVIVHGYNGFLCEAGNANDLAQILMHISDMDLSSRIQIQKNAFETAIKMSDAQMAKDYLETFNEL